MSVCAESDHRVPEYEYNHEITNQSDSSAETDPLQDMEKRSRTNVLRVMILEDRTDYEKFANERHGPAMSEAAIEIVDDAFIPNFLEQKLWADEMSDMGR